MVSLKNNQNNQNNFRLRILDLIFLVGIISVLWINFFALVEASENENSRITAEDKCPLCLDEVNNCELKCEHSFCEDCIVNWAANSSSSTCPLCRTALNEDRHFEFLVDERKRFGKESEKIDIYEACINGMLGIVKVHYLNGVDFLMLNESLRMAFNHGHLDIFEYLIKKGADINQRGDRGELLLNDQCESKNLCKVEYLLAKGASPNLLDNNGFSPLLLACQNCCDEKSVELIKILLDSKADFNITNSNEDTPLRLACKCGSLDAIKLLVGHGVNFKDDPEVMSIVSEVMNIELNNGSADFDINKLSSYGNVMFARRSKEGSSFDIISFNPVKEKELESPKLINTSVENIKFQINSPVFSFDGTKVAIYDYENIFLMDLDLNSNENMEPLVQFNFNSSDWENVYHLNITDLSFSPNGKKLVFVSWYQIFQLDIILKDDNTYKFENFEEIYRIERENVKNVEDEINLKYPTFSPDGKFVICIKELNYKNYSILIINVEGKELVNEFKSDSKLSNFAIISYENEVGIAFTEYSESKYKTNKNNLLILRKINVTTVKRF